MSQPNYFCDIFLHVDTMTRFYSIYIYIMNLVTFPRRDSVFCYGVHIGTLIYKKIKVIDKENIYKILEK